MTTKSKTIKRKASEISITKSNSNEADEIDIEELPLDFVKQYLRIDHDLDDVEIQVYIKAAKSYVLDYIKADEDQKLDYALIIPTLTLIAHCYENKAVNIKSTEKMDAMFKGVLDMYRGDLL